MWWERTVQAQCFIFDSQYRNLDPKYCGKFVNNSLWYQIFQIFYWRRIEVRMGDIVTYIDKQCFRLFENLYYSKVFISCIHIKIAQQAEVHQTVKLMHNHILSTVTSTNFKLRWKNAILCSYGIYTCAWFKFHFLKHMWQLLLAIQASHCLYL